MKIKKIFLAVAASISPVISFAHDVDGTIGGYGMMNMMGTGGWGTGWGSFWFLIMSLGALAWVVVGVLLAIWLFKQIGKK